jgi:hypothetical protein
MEAAMTVRGWLSMLAVGLVAAVMISGSGGFVRTEQHAEFDGVRARLDAALDDVEARLQVLETRSGGVRVPVASAADSAPSVAPQQLLARHAAIVACLDSLAQASTSEWRGAMPGLRAAIADLEYRTDLAELASADGAVALDTVMTDWLFQMDEQLAGLSRDAKTRMDADAINRAGVTQARLAERFAALRRHGNDGDLTPRRALAAEVAELRRSMRALMRSLDNPADSPS